MEGLALHSFFLFFYIINDLTQVNRRLTPDTYTTSWKGKDFFFLKQGHIVVMTSPNDLPIGQTLDSGTTILFTVPEEFKPANLTYGPCSNDISIIVSVNDRGNIIVYSPIAINGPHNMGLTFV